MSLDNIKRKNNIIFLFNRYFKIINGFNGDEYPYLKKICNNNLLNYDNIYEKYSYSSFYKDLGFIQGVLHSNNLINIDEDEDLFQRLFDSIENQSPENLY